MSFSWLQAHVHVPADTKPIRVTQESYFLSDKESCMGNQQGSLQYASDEDPCCQRVLVSTPICSRWDPDTLLEHTGEMELVTKPKILGDLHKRLTRLTQQPGSQSYLLTENELVRSHSCVSSAQPYEILRVIPCLTGDIIYGYPFQVGMDIGPHPLLDFIIHPDGGRCERTAKSVTSSVLTEQCKKQGRRREEDLISRDRVLVTAQQTPGEFTEALIRRIGRIEGDAR